MINMIKSVVDKLIRDDGEISTTTLAELYPALFDDSFLLEEGLIFGETEKCMDFICDYLNKKNIVLPEFGTVKVVNTDKFDSVSHPSHYTEGRKYEPRKVIADWELDFNLGSAVKYIARAGRKGDKIEDLQKAIQFIKFEIEDCSKISKYDEILDSFKSRSKKEQIQIIQELKTKLNKI